MSTIPKEDIKRRELSYKASKDVLKATNVFPSPQFVYNIFNDNRQQNAIFSDDLMRVFGKHIEEVMENGEENSDSNNQT